MCKFVHLIWVALGCAILSLRAGGSELVQVTTAPRLKQHEQGPFLVVGDSTRLYYLLAGAIPVSFDTNRIYTFTILDDASHRMFIGVPFDGIFSASLIKAQLDGVTVYDVEVCERHNAKMEHKEVRIIYGLYRPGPDAPSAEIERQLFPHRHEYSFGGCVGGVTGPKTEQVYVCGQCKLAYEKWKSDKTGKK